MVEEADPLFSCPACRGRKRAHTRDHRCRFGPAGGARAAMLQAEVMEDPPLQYHGVMQNSGMQGVSVKDVNASYGPEREEWKLAMERELASLREHGVFEVLTPEEAISVRRNEAPPMLALPGIKPADEAGYRRKKIRGVFCGIYSQSIQVNSRSRTTLTSPA